MLAVKRGLKTILVERVEFHAPLYLGQLCSTDCTACEEGSHARKGQHHGGARGFGVGSPEGCRRIVVCWKVAREVRRSCFLQLLS